jgi:hypothetical protein
MNKAEKDKIDIYFAEGNGNRICDICGLRIPSNIKDLGTAHSKYQVSFKFRACERCILQIAKKCNKKAVKEWEKIMIVKEL